MSAGEGFQILQWDVINKEKKESKRHYQNSGTVILKSIKIDQAREKRPNASRHSFDFETVRTCLSTLFMSCFRLGHHVLGLRSRRPSAPLCRGCRLHNEQWTSAKSWLVALLRQGQAREPLHNGHQVDRRHFPRLRLWWAKSFIRRRFSNFMFHRKVT